MNLNKVILVGRLTQDPEERSLPSGRTVTNFSMATNRVYNDKDGNKQEETEYHDIVYFGKTAEVAAQYLSKGKMCLVEGRLQTRSWEDKDTGKKRYRTEIIGRNLQLGPRPQGELDSSQKNQSPPPRGQKKQQPSRSDQNNKQKQKPSQNQDEDEEEVDVEDIPF